MGYARIVVPGGAAGFEAARCLVGAVGFGVVDFGVVGFGVVDFGAVGFGVVGLGGVLGHGVRGLRLLLVPVRPPGLQLLLVPGRPPGLRFVLVPVGPPVLRLLLVPVGPLLRLLGVPQGELGEAELLSGSWIWQLGLNSSKRVNLGGGLPIAPGWKVGLLRRSPVLVERRMRLLDRPPVLAEKRVRLLGRPMALPGVGVVLVGPMSLEHRGGEVSRLGWLCLTANL